MTIHQGLDYQSVNHLGQMVDTVILSDGGHRQTYPTHPLDVD